MTTPTPSSDEISVALDALRTDATMWDGFADTLRTAVGAAQSLVVPPSAFSFAGQSVATQYDAIRNRMATLLEGGAVNFDATATALRQSADAYEDDEATGAHMMTGIY